MTIVIFGIAHFTIELKKEKPIHYSKLRRSSFDFELLNGCIELFRCVLTNQLQLNENFHICVLK